MTGSSFQLDANRVPGFRKVSQAVHPKDEMFLTAKVSLPGPGQAFHYYFYSGGTLANRLAEYLSASGTDPAESSILDFACGYGRVTRYLVNLFREATCSDLEPDMLDFNHQNFGSRSFLSNSQRSSLVLPDEQYDVVFCFSLFTHLNVDIWMDWFRAVFSLVRPGGYFFFSTRGTQFATRRGEQLSETGGATFLQKNETRGRLDSSVYGQITLTQDWVLNAISREVPDGEYIRYFPMGEFDMYQDMHVVRRRVEPA